MFHGRALTKCFVVSTDYEDSRRSDDEELEEEEEEERDLHEELLSADDDDLSEASNEQLVSDLERTLHFHASELEKVRILTSFQTGPRLMSDCQQMVTVS